MGERKDLNAGEPKGAMDMNLVIVSGRLTMSPENIPYKKGDGSDGNILKFSVAVNRHWNKGDGAVKDTNFVRVSIYDALAVKMAGILDKGSHVLVSGSLDSNRAPSKAFVRVETLEAIAAGMTALGQACQQNGAVNILEHPGFKAVTTALCNPTFPDITWWNVNVGRNGQLLLLGSNPQRTDKTVEETPQKSIGTDLMAMLGGANAAVVTGAEMGAEDGVI